MSEMLQVVPLKTLDSCRGHLNFCLCCTPGWLQSLSKLAIFITCIAIQVEATPSQHAEHTLGKHSFANFKCLLSLKPSAKAPDKAFSLPGTAVPEDNLSVCTLFQSGTTHRNAPRTSSGRHLVLFACCTFFLPISAFRLCLPCAPTSSPKGSSNQRIAAGERHEVKKSARIHVSQVLPSEPFG